LNVKVNIFQKQRSTYTLFINSMHYFISFMYGVGYYYPFTRTHNRMCNNLINI